MSRYLLGYDIGSSSVKASLLNADTGELVVSATSPEVEMQIQSINLGWAEQEPDLWWSNLKEATAKILSKSSANVQDIAAIGISYQMHGLVLVDKDQKVLRPSIIWCDSRAVGIGEDAFNKLGEEFCLSNYLNSPGNFTASKLKWVKDNEPEVFEKVYKAMLPGDYIAMKLTGEIQTTVSGLSEGIFWNFKKKKIATDLLEVYGIDPELLPQIVPTFSEQGKVSDEAAKELGLSSGTVVSYRAGDQPNNAFSLNVLRFGEVAANAGTSGVVYGIVDKPAYDKLSRVNTFVHVNNTQIHESYGVLLCVNGTGILNSWMKKELCGGKISYEEMNALAENISIGSDGLSIVPFGNGAERILENKEIGAQIHNLNFNRHGLAHILRAGQEGIVFSLNFGFQIMKDMGMKLDVVKAGYANMFLSPLFREAFANTTGAVVELYNTDGSQGAARGAGVGAGIYNDFSEAFLGLKKIMIIEPSPNQEKQYQDAYYTWKNKIK
jgi:xylulokinase